ncbi:MAG TPA: electron transfer flavoprotein subunit alpha/FixB family protein [Sneathiellales bacterium]|nr:electron transfer flavoprotein subunit alpha/FixB family protein [Sneathiellales bacterium]
MSFRSAPAIATLRPKSQEPLAAEPGRQGETISLDINIPPETIRVNVRERRQNVEQGVRLDEAEIVISGGRGLGGPDGFKILEELADALGGAVGASRPACDLGWYPQAHQVGISGKTVAPDLYIAVGISGAGQHMAGCAGAKVLVAINKDPDASIFSYAHIGIASEYQEILPEILELIRR